MTQYSLLIGTLLLLFLPMDKSESMRYDTEAGCHLRGAYTYLTEEELTSMEALELVKNKYAYDFVRTEAGQAGEYGYRLPETGLYLSYEGMSKDGRQYFFHLYEYVAEDTATGSGHYYTYGWYAVDIVTGEITDQTN